MLCLYIFELTGNLSHKIVKTLEQKLDRHKIKSDMVHIHGELDKYEKFYFTCFFCSDLNVPGYTPNTLVGTSAVNVGVDYLRVDFILQIGWPHERMRITSERNTSNMLHDGQHAFVYRHSVVHLPGCFQ